MEAVVLDAEGKSSFQALQAALGEGGDADRIIAYAFDLLYLDGEDLTKLPLTTRKDKLRALLNQAKPGQSLRYSEHIAGEGTEIFAKACDTGLEGIVSKKADAPYMAGRQKSWLKTKCAQRQEFVILAYSGDVVAQARQAEDTARRVTAHFLLWLFLALLAGAFSASYAATIGGRQRDHVKAV